MGYLVFSFLCLIQDQFYNVCEYFYGVLCVYKWQTCANLWKQKLLVEVVNLFRGLFPCQDKCDGIAQEGRAAVLATGVAAAGPGGAGGAGGGLPSHRVGCGTWTVTTCGGFSILLRELFHFPLTFPQFKMNVMSRRKHL